MKTPILSLLLLFLALFALCGNEKPHVVLVMADDQGWGQMGYQGHPDILTPNLDEMVAQSLRFDRFYAGASNCSPSRATVLTGRSNDRTGVLNHGFPLRLQEKTIAQALQGAGYVTGHFGKWHLNGLRGPGVPVLETDTHHPGAFGFDHWLTVTNFFDRDPIMGRLGEFEEFEGDSSEVAMEEAIAFIRNESPKAPTFTVVWYGTPHDPMVASDEDRAPFTALSDRHQHQYGEILALDRSVGDLRSALRELKIADNTLVWYCSDNGGLNGFGPDTMGGLRGSKNTMYEGGLRVPGILEWPAKIPQGRVSDVPAGTVDIFPTLADIAGLPSSSWIEPQDGMSLLPLINGEELKRSAPLPFRHDGRGVLIGERYKLLFLNGRYELYDLIEDSAETTNLIESDQQLGSDWIAKWEKWNDTVEASLAGADYPGGTVDSDQPERRFWNEDSAYDPFLEEFRSRPEYGGWLKKRRPVSTSK